MQVGKAIVAGILAALAMTVALALAKVLGSPVDLIMMLGSLLTAEADSATWLVGFAAHLVMGALFAIAYAALFEYSAHRAGADVGAAIGVVHALFSGLMLGAAPLVHPLMPEQAAEPGLFLSGHGLAGVLLFFGLHALYGAVVGSMYAPVKAEHSGPLAAAR